MNLTPLAIVFMMLSFGISTPTRAGTIGWEECLRIALKESPTLHTFEADLASARSQLDGSKAAFLPTLAANVNVNASRLDSRPTGLAAIASTSPIHGLSADPWDRQYGMSVTLRQSLFNGFRDQAALASSRSVVESAEAAVTLARIDLIRDLRRAFDEALYLRHLIRLNENALERRRQNLAIVQLRYEGGRENKGSLLRSQVSLAQAETDVVQSKRHYALALEALQRTMGRTLPDDTLVEGELRSPTVPEQTPDFAGLVQKSLERRIAVAGVDAQSSSLRGERARYYPELAAEGNVTRAAQEWPPTESRYTIGLSLTVPLFNGKTPTNVRAAEAGLVKARATLAEVERTAIVACRQSYVALVDWSERVALQAQLLEAAELQSEIARDQYTLGLTSFQNWGQIEDDLINDEKSLLLARKEAAFALADWERVTASSSEETPQ